MPKVLHLLKGDDPSLAVPVITRQAESGDTVTLVLIQGASAPELPGTVTVHRVPDDLSHHQLLDLIFTADTVMCW